MKIFKEIFGRIWAAWGILLFVFTMFVFMIPYIAISFMKEPKRTVYFIGVSKIWMTIFLFGIACPLRIKGKHIFKSGKNFIIVCNHNSYMDVPVTCPFIPGGNKTIAKQEMSSTPVFGMLYKMGSVLVDRKSEKSRRESFIKMKEILDLGLHMCIYPEGTRNKSGEPIKPFHDGAFRLAIETGKEIIPTVIFHTKKVLPTEKTFLLWPHPLEMHFLDPVKASGESAVAELREKVYNIMKEYYIQRM